MTQARKFTKGRSARMPGGDERLPFVYRSRWVCWLAAFVATVLALIPTFAILELVPDSARVAVGIPVGALFIGAAVWRAFQVELIVHEDGVSIRNYFTRREMRWSEIGEITGANVTGSIAVDFMDREQPHKFFLRGTHSMATQFGGPKERKQELLEVLRACSARHNLDCKVDLRKNGTFYTRENWPEHLRG
jgi:hypothetical protein